MHNLELLMKRKINCTTEQNIFFKPYKIEQIDTFGLLIGSIETIPKCLTVIRKQFKLNKKCAV